LPTAASSRDETIFPADEAGLKHAHALIRAGRTTGAVMLNILNAIYVQFLQAALPGINQGARR
jgi:hypothetical protein